MIVKCIRVRGVMSLYMRQFGGINHSAVVGQGGRRAAIAIVNRRLVNLRAIVDDRVRCRGCCVVSCQVRRFRSGNFRRVYHATLKTEQLLKTVTNIF